MDRPLRSSFRHLCQPCSNFFFALELPTPFRKFFQPGWRGPTSPFNILSDLANQEFLSCLFSYEKNSSVLSCLLKKMIFHFSPSRHFFKNHHFQKFYTPGDSGSKLGTVYHRKERRSFHIFKIQRDPSKKLAFFEKVIFGHFHIIALKIL